MMFGTNPIRKQELGQVLAVQSIFPTIQGEGPFVGTPAVFVRLWGCNLRCFFCDTDFETKRQDFSTDELVARLEQLTETEIQASLLVLTGGEPLRQNILPLCERVTQDGWLVQLETAGTVWVPGLEKFFEDGDCSLTIVCSPKAGKVHPMIEKYCRDWKYLIKAGDQDAEDGLPIMSTQIQGQEQKLYRPPEERPDGDLSDTIWLQPCEEYHVEKINLAKMGMDPEQMVTAAARDEALSQRNIQSSIRLAMKHGYRISLQTHKILGLP
jgi:7-carboxy-7-deazaguanine synthase